jgi:hypothetical protein
MAKQWLASQILHACLIGLGFYPVCLQVMRIADRGCDIVRITVQGKKEADACFDIKNTLVQKG